MPSPLALTHHLALGLGALFLVLSAIGFLLRWSFVAGARRCPARVLRIGRSGSRHYEIVGFQSPDGQPHQARLLSSGRAARPVGTHVDVLFNPDRPGRVLGPTWWDAWGSSAAGICTGMGLVVYHLARSSLF